MFPKIMGILNRTPDSFSDGGRFTNFDAAIRHSVSMQQEGADFIDIGGESTRPGAEYVSEQQELDRVIPLIEVLRAQLDIPISIDTYKPVVMQAAVSAGAGLINDIKALREKGALNIAKQFDVPIILMHMLGEPRTMQTNPQYADVVQDISDFFRQRIEACEQAGIDNSRLWLDPGFGFGKNDTHNLNIIKRFEQFKSLDLPLVVGVSRKSSIGRLLDRDVNQRLAGSLALTVLAVERGARMIRTHDVKATRDAIFIAQATLDVERA